MDVKSSPRIPPVVSGVKLRSTQKKDVNYEQNIPSFQKQDPELNPVESISAVVRDFDRARVPAKRSSTFVKSRTKSDSFGDQTSSSSELAQMFDKFQRRKVVQNDGVKTGSDEAAGNSAMLGRSTECCDGKISKEKNSLNDELESSACTGRLVSMQIRSLSHSADSTSARMSIRNCGVFSNAGPHQRRDSKEKSVEIKSEETKKGSDDKTTPNSNSKRKAFSTSGKNSASMNRAFTPAAIVTPIPTVSLKNVHESVSENKKDFNLKKTHTDMIAKRRSSSSASVGIVEKAPATELPMKFHSKPVGDLKKIANADDPGATGKSENHNSSLKCRLMSVQTIQNHWMIRRS